jgi:hypothetical protein
MAAKWEIASRKAHEIELEPSRTTIAMAKDFDPSPLLAHQIRSH